MSRTRTTRTIVAILTMIAAVTMTGLGAGNASAAPTTAARPATVTKTVYENYACSDIHDVGGTVVAKCDGYWYHADSGNRSFILLANVSYTPSDYYHTTAVTHIETIFGTAKIVHWYCRKSDRTSSGLLASTSIGGGLANYHNWPNGYQPCDGTDKGLIAVVVGKDQYGINRTSTIDVNSVESGYLHHSCTCTYDA
jgi:hypothetical protein